MAEQAESGLTWFQYLTAGFERKRAGWFAFMSYECLAVALPHDAMGWSTVCDCGIS